MTNPSQYTRRRFISVAAVAGLVCQAPRVTTAQSGPLAQTFVIGGLDARDEAGPYNTDVLILVRIEAQAGMLRAISIPRDLYVTMPAVGADKINRAFDYGRQPDGDWHAGADFLAATIGANFGVSIDGTVLTTFDGFRAVIDAVGGVNVVNPYDVYDAEYPTEDLGTEEIFYPAGPLHLDGEAALEFCRTRHQDADGGRVMRQQLVLRALLDRMRDPELGDGVAGVLSRLRDAVWTDMPWQEQLSLAIRAPDIEQESLVFSSLVPLLVSGTTAEGAWIYTGDWSEIAWYVQAFLDGNTEPLV